MSLGQLAQTDDFHDDDDSELGGVLVCVSGGHLDPHGLGHESSSSSEWSAFWLKTRDL